MHRPLSVYPTSPTWEQMLAASKFLWTVLWSAVGAGLAALYLAVQGLVDEDKRSGSGILIAGGFLALSSIVNFAQDQSLTRQMTRSNVRLTQRLTALIGSLGEISGDSYHVWKVEVYATRWKLRCSRDAPWILGKSLVRRASVSLVSTVGIADGHSLVEKGPIGRCFWEQRQVVWLDPQISAASALDCYCDLSVALNEQLAHVCGVMRAIPIASHLDSDCVGVLAIHVEPQFAPRFADTIVQEDCARRLRAAAVDLYQIIRGDNAE